MERKNNYVQIGMRIRQAREAKELTQSQLADKLKVPLTATAISLYEKGEREVSIDVLKDISEITDTSLEYLATGTVGESPNIHVALRADPELSKNPKARAQVMDFIEYVKNKSKENDPGNLRPK